jgi:hypothetical protein
VTLFVNGGVHGTHKQGGVVALDRILHALQAATKADTLSFADQMSGLLSGLRSEHKSTKKDIRHVFSDGTAVAWDMPPPSALPTSPLSYSCAADVDVLCDSAQRCAFYGDNNPLFSICRSGDCACDPALDCTWLGASKTNHQCVAGGGKLPNMVDGHGRQSNISFYEWACSRIHLAPGTINQCGFERLSVFAVGADRLQLYNRSFYTSLCDEFFLYGTTGAIMGHFMERMWRPMFVRRCHFTQCTKECSSPMLQE